MMTTIEKLKIHLKIAKESAENDEFAFARGYARGMEEAIKIVEEAENVRE